MSKIIMLACAAVLFASAARAQRDTAVYWRFDTIGRTYISTGGIYYVNGHPKLYEWRWVTIDTVLVIGADVHNVDSVYATWMASRPQGLRPAEPYRIGPPPHVRRRRSLPISRSFTANR